MTFKIKLTEDGLVAFDECALAEEWFEETKVPKKKEKKDEKKDDKKDEEMKDEKKEAAEPEKMEEE